MQDQGDADLTADFIGWRQAPRSAGFLKRLASWEARVGKVIVPYDRMGRGGEG